MRLTLFEVDILQCENFSVVLNFKWNFLANYHFAILWGPQNESLALGWQLNSDLKKNFPFKVAIMENRPTLVL